VGQYDECALTTGLHWANRSKHMRAVTYNHCQLRSLQGCAAFPPTNLPAAAFDVSSPTYDEIVTTACLSPLELPNCFLNLGARVMADWTDSAALRAYFADMAKSDASTAAYTCRAAVLCNASTASTDARLQAWCEQQALRQEAVRRALQVTSQTTKRSIRGWCDGLAWDFERHVCYHPPARKAMLEFSGTDTDHFTHVVAYAAKRIRDVS
jgi:hypothetical protein